MRGQEASPAHGMSAEGTHWGPTAFRAAFEQHGAAVHALVCRVAWPEAAEDVTQEVFLRLWRHPDRYDPTRGSLRTYLSMVAHSAALDLIRSDTARRAREGRHVAETCATAPVDEADHHITRAAQASDIVDALATLDPAERSAVVTAFYGECTYREAALALGVAEGTVKSRIRRGLRHLKDALDENPGSSAARPANPSLALVHR